jgi:pimeloyl-ACP methyl ester carboxylesterase
MNKLTLIFSTLFLSLLLNACGGSSSSSIPAGARGGLISASLISSKKVLLLPYKVDAYKIIYSTVDANGSPIKASGLLAIPQKTTTKKSPFLSYQHGTIFLDSQAPSISATSISGISTLSGMGFVVSAPDYIGYGESSSIMHPYIHADSLANASIDMLRASKNFLQQKSIKLNSQLFLTGYSEGGYATLALQKKLQESHTDEFTVTASAAAAGPFDLTETAKTIANKANNPKPAFMSFVLKAYDDIYQLNKVSEMFQSPYINIVNTYFDGTHSSSSINSGLNHTTMELFNSPFLTALQGSAQHSIKDKLTLNNIYDWKPTAPTRFYHSLNDEIVPYHNAQKAFNTMTANGAIDVTLKTCPSDTHASCAVPYVFDTLDFFSRFSHDL